MTLKDIKEAVEAGKTVNWSNSSYQVIKDDKGQFLIAHDNGSAIGLTHQDDVTLNGKESDFFINPL